jgi:hypothetical protein
MGLSLRASCDAGTNARRGAGVGMGAKPKNARRSIDETCVGTQLAIQLQVNEWIKASRSVGKKKTSRLVPVMRPGPLLDVTVGV